MLDVLLLHSAATLEVGQSPESAEAPSPTPQQPFAAVATLPKPRERDDTYPCLARIGDDCRVIEGSCGIQWILQLRHRGRWRNVSYHLDRDVLIERCGR